MRILGWLLAALLSVILAVTLWDRSRREPVADPVMVLVNQVRTRALLDHERRLTVWYRSCPEVPGLNPEVFVLWPAVLRYTLRLDAAQIQLTGTTLSIKMPTISSEEPSVPSDLTQFIANNPFWNLESNASLGAREMRRATPIARYLSSYFLQYDPTLRDYFDDELRAYLKGITGALGITVTDIEVSIPEPKQAAVPMLPLELCEGSSAVANGVPFARDVAGELIRVLPRQAGP
ncbi:MAG TPA: hypothetical protein P5528_13600 [Steroidobacteraceae bacterium]|nr:hypothetical protein [Steroidobacteraceae bacterium]HRX90471.1 hypothetical protein [Steroidobacteraceae bacterium]